MWLSTGRSGRYFRLLEVWAGFRTTPEREALGSFLSNAMKFDAVDLLRLFYTAAGRVNFTRGIQLPRRV